MCLLAEKVLPLLRLRYLRFLLLISSSAIRCSPWIAYFDTMALPDLSAVRIEIKHKCEWMYLRHDDHVNAYPKFIHTIVILIDGRENVWIYPCSKVVTNYYRNRLLLICRFTPLPILRNPFMTSILVLIVVLKVLRRCADGRKDIAWNGFITLFNYVKLLLHWIAAVVSWALITFSSINLVILRKNGSGWRIGCLTQWRICGPWVGHYCTLCCSSWWSWYRFLWYWYSSSRSYWTCWCNWCWYWW